MPTRLERSRNVDSRCLERDFESRQKGSPLFRALLLLIIVSGSFNSMAQYVISIGSPANSIEGTLDAYFLVSIDGGTLNTTGSDITGTVTLSGTSTVVDDYTDVLTFAIPNGANSVAINVPVINDTEVEITETIVATISAPSTGTISAQNSSSADIMDDDDAELLVNILNAVDGTEGLSDAQFTIQMFGALINGTGGDITGDITYTGTADSMDFTQTVSFGIPDGTNSVDVLLPVVNDSSVENTELIIATISNVNFGSVGLSAADTALIFDDEGPIATISISLLNDGIEGEVPTDVAFVVSLDGNTVNGTGGSISGQISLSGTAETDVDYEDVTSFNIASGGSKVTVYIPVIDDQEIEAIESVIAFISNPSIGAISANYEAAGNIIDNDLNEGDQVNYIVSPNNDGENDMLVMLGLDNYPEHELKIYNRWGNLVFGARAYQNNWAGESNSGDVTLGSGLLPNGTYFYTVDLGSGGKTNKGYIELVK